MTRRKTQPLISFLHQRAPIQSSRQTRQHSTSSAQPHAPPTPALISSPPTSNPRLRFAPSPTGYLHLGGLRTALFNHLLARKWHGKWILRIEDTDRSRLVPDAISSLQSALEWAGLNPDEGPGSIGGNYGPYIQSERLDKYHHYSNRLLDQDKAYCCFCSAATLAEIRTEQMQRKATNAYDGRCRNLSEEEVRRRKNAGEKYVVRFKAPDTIPPNPPDLIFGEYSNQPSSSASSSSSSPSTKPTWNYPQPPQIIPHTPSSSHEPLKQKGPGTFASNSHEDFILIKSDGWPTYHLASVVDDWEMQITHVLRGEEWLPSTTKHIQLYSALSLTPPQFAHLPLLTNPDGTKLSKRTGDVRVEDYRAKGYEPSALINFLGLMGWDHHKLNSIGSSGGGRPFFPSGERSKSLVEPEQRDLRTDLNTVTELFTLPALIESFDIGLINHRRSAVFLPKLDWLNKMHLRRAGMRRSSEEGKKAELVENLMQDEGSGGRRDRKWLVARVMEMLRDSKVLKGCASIEDEIYVGKVLDAELPRATVLKDISELSIFFFLDPDYSRPEAKDMLSPGAQTIYAEIIDLFLAQLASQPESSWSKDTVWDSLNSVMKAMNVRKRQVVITPLRHALTGRKTGPSLPEIILTLGQERCLKRLQRAAAYQRQETAEKGSDVALSL